MSALTLQPLVGSRPARRHLSLVPPRTAAGSEPAARGVRRADVAPDADRDGGSGADRAGAPGPRTLRITRRGRLALTLSTGAMVVASGLLAVAPSAASPAAEPAPASAPATTEVVVLPGQTLWGLAEDVAPADADVRDVVVAIREMNGMRSSAVAVGDTLALPA